MIRDSIDSVASPATVQLVVSHQAQLDLAQALSALTNLEWLGSAEASPPGQPGSRRVNTTLALQITDGSSAGPVRKSALVDIGPPEVLDRAIRTDVSWQSDSMTPLFPVFAGRLTISPTELLLEGHYAPPFGRLGLLIDERLLHFIARRTAQAFLTRLAARIGG